MSALVDHRFAMLLSSRLPNFKIKKTSPLLINSRCVICGDSQKKKRLGRFYIYVKNGSYMVCCHNCGYIKPLGKFIKTIDPVLYNEYLFETFQEQRQEDEERGVEIEEVKEIQGVSLKGLTKISKLHHDHPAKKYVESRQIPSNTHYKLYFTPHFAKWVNSVKPDTLYDKLKVDPRLILPLLDRNGSCFGVQGRDLSGKSDLRYITIRFDENFPKLYGLESFNPNYKGYMVEGPIDSLFIPNCIAMAGADVSLDEVIRVSNCRKDNMVRVFDNEPRNPQMIARVEKAIANNENVCIWPSSIKQKDINDMYCAGLDPKKIIDNNTYNGLEAQLQLTTYRKD